MKLFYGKFLITAVLSLGLIACNSSSSDDDSGDSGTGGGSLSASDISVVIDTANDIEPIDVLASASGPSGATITLESVSEPEYGTAVIEDNQVFYTPEVGFTGFDSFNYVVSDGNSQAEATVEVEVVTTVAVVGRVVDSPIANATVTIMFAGNRYEVTADEDGYYELPVTLRALDTDEVVRVSARGSDEHNQGHVTLSSILMSSEALLEQANANGEITREELHEVNVTHVTTARDVLMRRAAKDEALTTTNMNEFGNAIDPQLLIQMAAVIKLVVDNDSFTLPDGFEDIESFLNSADDYNEFVEEASQGGESSPLNQAIAETLNDPDVMPELRLEDLYGRFVEVERSPSFMMPRTFTTWDINQDGLTWFSLTSNTGGRTSLSLNGNQLTPDDGTQYLQSVTGFYYISESDFDGDTKAWEAWHAQDESYSSVELVTYTFLESARVISAATNELLIRSKTTRTREAYPFSHEGVDYEIPAYTSHIEHDVRLVSVETLKGSELVFDFEAQPTWLLPNVEPAMYSAYIYQFNADHTFERLAQPYSNLDPGVINSEPYSGEWELSEDKRTLYLTQNDKKVRLIRHSAEDEHQSVLAEYLDTDGNSTAVALVDSTPLDGNAVFTAIDELIDTPELVFNSIVNSSAAIYWSEDDQLLIHDFMFNFEPNGVGHQYTGFCEGERLYAFEALCPEPMTIGETVEAPWEYTKVETLGDVFQFTRNTGETNRAHRYWLPIGFSERNILTVLEWDNAWYKDYSSNEWEFNYMIQTRINHYQYAEKPAEATPGNSATSFSLQSMSSNTDAIDVTNLGYKIINPQPPIESVIKH